MCTYCSLRDQVGFKLVTLGLGAFCSYNFSYRPSCPFSVLVIENSTFYVISGPRTQEIWDITQVLNITFTGVVVVDHVHSFMYSFKQRRLFVLRICSCPFFGLLPVRHWRCKGQQHFVDKVNEAFIRSLPLWKPAQLQ